MIPPLRLHAWLGVLLVLLTVLAPTAPAASAPSVPVPSASGQPACRTQISIDTPLTGAVVSTSVLVKGWALDTEARDGSGISAVDLYLDGEMGTAALLGTASRSLYRPDVDAAFARPSSQAGWEYTWDLANVTPGSHVLLVAAQDGCGWSSAGVQVTVNSTTITVDRPPLDAMIPSGQALSVAGWSFNQTIGPGSAVDAMAVFLDAEASEKTSGGSARIGLARPDVAAALRQPTAASSGFSVDLALAGLLPGRHTLYVYAHSVRNGWSYRTLPFVLTEPTIPRAPLPAGRPHPSGQSGVSVSFPQCDAELPTPPFPFAIVGVTGGRAFYENRCLARQFAWARTGTAAPSVYLNLNAPSGRTRERGMSGPAGECNATNEICQAYNFGYKTALHAVAYARSQGVSAPFWWLDVETENTWSDSVGVNSVVVRGGIDGLRSLGLTGIGIYSTTLQWREIAGSYRPGLPVWAAGPVDLARAQAACSTDSFGGGTVVLVQYPNGALSGEYAC